MANIVAIVGRPNVGKSTLFNRLTGTRRAIVNNTAGTTRDRQYGKAEWCGREFSVIDTGGWVVNSDDTFESEINRQVDLAIREADVVLLVVDVNEGVTQFDTEVAHLLRQAKKPTILAVNKVDTFENQYGAAEFYKLGLGEPFIVSAENGLGTGDLLDEVVVWVISFVFWEKFVSKARTIAHVLLRCLKESLQLWLTIVDRRYDPRQYLHTVQQVRQRFLLSRYRRYPQESESDGGLGVLLCCTLHPCHREQRCMYIDD